jgi:hypothetical protein
MHVGEAEVAALEAEGELLVVEAEQVEDRRVDVVDVRTILDGAERDPSPCRSWHIARAEGCQSAIRAPALVSLPYSRPVIRPASLSLFDKSPTHVTAPPGLLADASQYVTKSLMRHPLTDTVFGTLMPMLPTTTVGD